MILENESRYPTEELRNYIKFCLRYSYQKGRDTKFIFTNWVYRGTEGDAGPDGHGGFTINIRFGKQKIPYVNTYKKSVGGIYVGTQKENAILYIAHEIRHIDFFSGWISPKQGEVDAEKFAATILGMFRLTKERAELKSKGFVF